MAAIPLAVTVVVVAIVSYVLVGVVRRYAVQRGMLDRPNQRSSHHTPTPRGAGIAIVLTVLLALLIASPRDYRTCDYLLGLVAFLPSAWAGWIDDRRGLSPMPRLVAHGMSGLLLVPLGISIVEGRSPAAVVLAIAIVAAAVIAATVVNFMDGLDAFIALQAVTFGAHLLALSAPESPSALVAAVIIAASLGFLPWNWHPARIFLGDVGSNALAILLLFAALLLVARDSVGFWSVFLPLFPLFFDATITLTLRALRGDPLAQAHRKHLYQRLANQRWGHRRVSIFYAGQALIGSIVVLLSSDTLRPLAYSAFALMTSLIWLALHQRIEQSAT